MPSIVIRITETITQIGYCLIVTELTAELVLISLLMTYKQLEKLGAYRLLDRLGRIALSLHFLPVIFCLLRWYHSGITSGITWGKMRPRGDAAFGCNGWICIVATVLIAIWIYQMIKQLKDMRLRRKRDLEWLNRDNDAPVAWRAKLEEMRQSMGVHRPVQLRMRYGLKSPLTCGIVRLKVMLPVRNYTERELEVVFTHELIHIRRKDVLCRTVLDVSECIFWFCPLLRKLHPLMNRWSESCTDISAGEMTGGGKAYFGAISAMILVGGEEEIHHGVCMTGGERIEERISRMKNYQNGRKRKGRNLVLTALCAVTVLSGSLTALAAGEGIAVASEAAYQLMENDAVTESAVPQANDGVEYVIEPGAYNDRVIIQNAVQEYYSTFKALAWEVPADYISETAYFDATNGGYIKVSMEIEPTDVTIYVGIVEPDGRRRYVIVSGEVYHTFTLTKSGGYKVYVENISQTTDIQIVGGYFYE